MSRHWYCARSRHPESVALKPDPLLSTDVGVPGGPPARCDVHRASAVRMQYDSNLSRNNYNYSHQSYGCNTCGQRISG